MAALVIALAAPSSAQAHAFLLATSPQLGARLATSPAKITLTFDEGVTPAQGGIELKRNGGGTAPTIGQAATTNGGKTLEISVGRLTPGVYVASWQIIADDGHFEAGALDFQVGNVGHLTAITATPRTPLPWSLVIARLVIYVGLALTFGRTVVALRVRHRLRGLTTVGAGLVALGAVWQLTALAAETGRGAIWTGIETGPLHAAMATHAGKLAALIILTATLQLVILCLAPRRHVPMIASGSMVIVLLALSGHSAYTRYTPLTVTLDVAHIAAAAVWLGGLVELGAIALRDRAQLWSHARRFAPYGFASAGTLAATGLYAAWVHVGHRSALTDTPYGRTILLKSALFASALTIGGFNHLTTRGGRSRAGSITLEPALLAMIVAVAAVLVNVAPPPPSALATAAPPALTTAAPLTGARINLAAPAGPTLIAVAASPTHVQVSAIRYDGTSASDAHLAVQHDPALRFTRCGGACLAATWTPQPGTQRLSVLIFERGAQRRVNFSFPWPLRRDQTKLLDTSINHMTTLGSVRLLSIVSSGFGGSPAISHGIYQPGHALRLTGGNGFALVTIGNTSWQRQPNSQQWIRLATAQQVDPFGNYAQQGAVNVRQLGTIRSNGRRVVVLAYWVPGQQYWYRVWIDPKRHLIIQDQIITPGHYLTDQYSAFNQPITIRPPAGVSP